MFGVNWFSRYLIAAFGFGLLVSIALPACNGATERSASVSWPQKSGEVKSRTDSPDRIRPATSAYAASQGRQRSSIDEFRPAEQRYLESKLEAYSGLIVAGDGLNESTLRQLGYPTLEEWISAKALSDDQLRAAATDGDAVMQVLLADRYSTRLIELLAKPDGIIEVGGLPGMVNSAIGVAMRTRPSPMLALIDARTNFAITGRQETLLAGYLAAEELGDPRTAKLAQHVREHNPVLSEQMVNLSVQGVMAMVPPDKRPTTP